MINLIKVLNREEGNLRAHELLKSLIDPSTLLVLSGGTSPDYSIMIVKPGGIFPGAVCLADERYGDPYHKGSNELLLDMCGLVDYFVINKIEIHKLLRGENGEKTAQSYEELVKKLFERLPKRVGVMGVGANYHTAGIFPNSEAVQTKKLVVYEKVEDKFPERVTLTLEALSKFSEFIILMFGQEKKQVLEDMLSVEEDVVKYPALFYSRSPVKSWVITDINL